MKVFDRTRARHPVVGGHLMSAGLDLARLIIDEHRPDGPCPRAAAILLRQHLEMIMARQRMAPGDVPSLGVQQRRIWLQLTRACRGEPPSAQQLREWADIITCCEGGTEQAQAVL
jgi:hypothetical protein